jgi:hypothetical protein
MKAFPALLAVSFINRIERDGMMNESLIRDVILKGCTVGSTAMTEQKINKNFEREVIKMLELYTEILKYNNLLPEEEEGNVENSEE